MYISNVTTAEQNETFTHYIFKYNRITTTAMQIGPRCTACSGQEQLCVLYIRLSSSSESMLRGFQELYVSVYTLLYSVRV